MLVENGIRAIWNFAHTDLNLPDNVVVENVHLSESLMRLSYNVLRYEEKTSEEKIREKKDVRDSYNRCGTPRLFSVSRNESGERSGKDEIYH